MHESKKLTGEYVPIGHESGYWLPTEQKLPVIHGFDIQEEVVQVEFDGQYCPAGQNLQSDMPGSS